VVCIPMITLLILLVHVGRETLPVCGSMIVGIMVLVQRRYLMVVLHVMPHMRKVHSFLLLLVMDSHIVMLILIQLCIILLHVLIIQHLLLQQQHQHNILLLLIILCQVQPIVQGIVHNLILQ
jgi:hypothetical protein